MGLTNVHCVIDRPRVSWTDATTDRLHGGGGPNLGHLMYLCGGPSVNACRGKWSDAEILGLGKSTVHRTWDEGYLDN